MERFKGSLRPFFCANEQSQEHGYATAMLA